MIQTTKDGLVLEIYVQPGASRSELAGEFDGRLKIRIKAPPIDNAANLEVIRFFTEKLAISKSQIQIISGEKSRKKRLLFSAVSQDQLTSLIQPKSSV